MQFFGYLFHYCNLPYANCGLFISLVQFLSILCPKNRTNEMNSQEFAQGNYLWNVLKNHSNEIWNNEIRIWREPPYLHFRCAYKTRYLCIAKDMKCEQK